MTGHTVSDILDDETARISARVKEILAEKEAARKAAATVAKEEKVDVPVVSSDEVAAAIDNEMSKIKVSSNESAPAKVNKFINDIIVKILIVANREYIILIGNDSFILRIIPHTSGITQAFNVKRVSAKNASNCIRNQGFDLTLKVCAAHGNVFVLHLGSKLVLQTVNFYKNSVQLFLIGFELIKSSIAFRRPFFVFV